MRSHSRTATGLNSEPNDNAECWSDNNAVQLKMLEFNIAASVEDAKQNFDLDMLARGFLKTREDKDN